MLYDSHVAFRLDHAIDHYRNDTDIAGERGRDLYRHKIIWIVDPAMATVVLSIEPIGTNDREENVTRRNLSI
jgi:hypothetical protein